MWTLFDQLVKQTEGKRLIGLNVRRQSVPKRGRSSFGADRFWRLLEPTGPLSCKERQTDRGSH